jgi:hypothetical protein
MIVALKIKRVIDEGGRPSKQQMSAIGAVMDHGPGRLLKTYYEVLPS